MQRKRSTVRIAFFNYYLINNSYSCMNHCYQIDLNIVIKVIYSSDIDSFFSSILEIDDYRFILLYNICCLFISG